MDPLEVYLAKKKAEAAPAAPAAPASAEADPLAAYLAKKKTVAAAPAPPQPAEEPGFLRQAYETAKGGARNLYEASKDASVGLYNVLRHPIDTVATPEGRARAAEELWPLNPAKRHEVERGVSDMVTGGLAQKLGEHVDQSMHDAFGTKQYMAPDQAEADARKAAPYRTVGHLGALVAPNPAGEVLGAGGQVVSATAERFAPKVAEAGAKAISMARGLGRVPFVGPAAEGLANYESVAPLQAAVTAPPGHRGEAAVQAATDPFGVVSSVAMGAAAPIRNKILGSEGAQARRFIEQHGEGARVGPLTSGKGGVFESQLRDVPATDAGKGEAAARGARGIIDDIEVRHEAEHGFPYRGGKELVREATQAKTAGAEDRRIAITVAKEARNANVDEAKSNILAETAKRGKKIISDIDHEKKVMASEPYAVLKKQLESKPEAHTPQDGTSLMTTMESAIYDAETSDFASAKLQSVIKKMERYRDESGKVMVPARQMNGFRRTLMRVAKVGHTDLAGEAEAPLRQAAFQARELVNQGPYAPLNALFAEGASNAEAARRAVGLKSKPGRDKFAEQEALTKRLRKAVADPSMIPGANVPAEADVSPLRQQLAAAKTSARPTIEAARAEAAGQRTNVEQARSLRAKGEEAAVADRQMLGIPVKIGTEKADLNQVGISLARPTKNDETSGRLKPDLEGYARAHPDQATNTRLPQFIQNKADLQFNLGDMAHGGLMHRVAPTSIYRTIKKNATPIAGRLLYGPALKLDPKLIARGLGYVRGASLGQKMKAAIEAQKEQQP